MGPVSQCSKPCSGFILPLAKTDGDLGPLESQKLSKAVLTAISNHVFTTYLSSSILNQVGFLLCL